MVCCEVYTVRLLKIGALLKVGGVRQRLLIKGMEMRQMVPVDTLEM